MVADAPIIDVDLETLKAGMRDGSIVLVDVREDEETARGRIPGAVAMPLSRFDPDELPIEDGQLLVFSCAAGVRSRLAIGAARRAGLDLSHHFPGGFKGWLAAGEPVES